MIVIYNCISTMLLTWQTVNVDNIFIVITMVIFITYICGCPKPSWNQCIIPQVIVFGVASHLILVGCSRFVPKLFVVTFVSWVCFVCTVWAAVVGPSQGWFAFLFAIATWLPPPPLLLDTTLNFFSLDLSLSWRILILVFGFFGWKLLAAKTLLILSLKLFLLFSLGYLISLFPLLLLF